VKLLSADDSVGSPHVKVGHCQVLIQKPRIRKSTGLFFIVRKNLSSGRFGHPRPLATLAHSWASSCQLVKVGTPLAHPCASGYKRIPAQNCQVFTALVHPRTRGIRTSMYIKYETLDTQVSGVFSLWANILWRQVQPLLVVGFRPSVFAHRKLTGAYPFLKPGFVPNLEK
jgi:hypothetical protein